MNLRHDSSPQEFLRWAELDKMLTSEQIVHCSGVEIKQGDRHILALVRTLNTTFNLVDVLIFKLGPMGWKRGFVS